MNVFTCHASLSPVVPAKPSVVKRLLTINVGNRTPIVHDMALDAVASPAFEAEDGEEIRVTVVDYTAAGIASPSSIAVRTVTSDDLPPAAPAPAEVVIDGVRDVPEVVATIPATPAPVSIEVVDAVIPAAPAVPVVDSTIIEPAAPATADTATVAPATPVPAVTAG